MTPVNDKVVARPAEKQSSLFAGTLIVTSGKHIAANVNTDMTRDPVL